VPNLPTMVALTRMIGEIPTACDRGTKCNAQGYKIS
jgi:hypothetical protein